MVKSISAKMNDELYNEALQKAREIGLNKSQIVRYAFAIVCGYSTQDAKVMALINPVMPFSELSESE